jgi:hypothetical protein
MRTPRTGIPGWFVIDSIMWRSPEEPLGRPISEIKPVLAWMAKHGEPVELVGYAVTDRDRPTDAIAIFETEDGYALGINEGLAAVLEGLETRLIDCGYGPLVVGGYKDGEPLVFVAQYRVDGRP